LKERKKRVEELGGGAGKGRRASSRVQGVGENMMGTRGINNFGWA